jgi:3-deoxy-7-phosphoheptulonate synthase
MSHSIFKSIEILPSQGEIKQEIPLHSPIQQFVAESRETIRNILNQKDPRLMVVVGPCSIHHPDSAIEFARRLIILQREIKDSFFLVMRVYTEKSRTTTGWKGLLNDPLLDGSEDVVTGIRWTRELLVKIAAMGVPTATEFLDPIASQYYEDLISWGCIGARTSESQTHRLMASGLPMPIAFKNSTQGCINNALNGMVCAAMTHKVLSVDNDGKVCARRTSGNPDLHIALRGGRHAPNYHKDAVEQVASSLRRCGLPEKILIDCSHGNSPKDESEQKVVFFNILEQITEGNNSIRGVIMESYLEGGNQSLREKPLHPHISVTDPCLDWISTEKLLLEGNELLQKWLKESTVESVSCAH